MNRFLLLALTAGLLSPIAAKAETYWLLLWRVRPDSFQWQIPTSSKEECNAALKKVLDKENWSGLKTEKKFTGGICVKGK